MDMIPCSRYNLRKTTLVQRKMHECGLKIISLNIRGLRSNIGELTQLCCSKKPDIVVVVETFLDSSVSERDECIWIPGYNIACRKDRNANGGGILIYSLEGLVIHHIGSNVPSHLEVIWFTTTFNHENILFAAIYRPPNSGDEIIYYLYSTATKIIDELGAKSLCLLGDFNAHHTNWLGSHNTDVTGELLLELCNFLKLSQIVHEPTRCDQILDLFLTDLPAKCSILPNCGTSDHNPVVIVIHKKRKP